MVGDSGFPGNVEVIPIAYAMVETVSLITLLFQHSTLASRLGIAGGKRYRGREWNWLLRLPGNFEITPYEVNPHCL